MITRTPQHDTRCTPTGRPLSLALAVAVTLLVICLPATQATAQLNILPEPARGLELENKLGNQVPADLPFVTSKGESVMLGDYFDGERPVLLVMFYRNCPVICPTIIDDVMKALNDLGFTIGKEFRVVLLSIDDRDRPAELDLHRDAILMRYNRARTKRVLSGFTYLTSPTPREPRLVGEAIGYPYRFLPESGEFSHAAGIHILTPDGKVSRFLSGLTYKTNDIRLGLLDASNGEIGDWMDKVALFCFHFDPEEGSYSLAAFRVMQVGGGLSAIAVGTLIGVLFWQDRRRKRRQQANESGDGSESKTSVVAEQKLGAMDSIAGQAT